MRYTLKEIQEKFEYNPETGEVFILNSGRWKKKKLAQAVSIDGYYRSNVNVGDKKMQILMHRVAWELYNKKLIGELIIDHRDQDKLNNKIDNLRVVTRAINNQNLGLKSNNKLGGHNIEKLPSGKYRARITVRSKKIHLGTFENLDDAIAAKLAANQKYGFHENHK